jgi:hypothetical protein
MPVPNASSARARFTVFDLTSVRAGPTAVRQLAGARSAHRGVLREFGFSDAEIAGLDESKVI